MVNTRLKEIMNKRGKGSTELAALIGISERNMRRIVAGGTTSDESVAAIARALEVSADWLLGISDDPSHHLQVDSLSYEEKLAIIAWRHGNKTEAVKIIVSR